MWHIMKEDSTSQNEFRKEDNAGSSGLPALPNASPETEALKRLLERMIENDRQRVRNQYLQLAVVVVLLLFGLLGTGIWFANQLFNNLRYERAMLEQEKQGKITYEISGKKMMVPDISDVEERTRKIAETINQGKMDNETKRLIARQQEELNQLYAQMAELQKIANQKITKEEAELAPLQKDSILKKEPEKLADDSKQEMPEHHVNVKKRNYLTLKLTNSPATMRIPLQLPPAR